MSETLREELSILRSFKNVTAVLRTGTMITGEVVFVGEDFIEVDTTPESRTMETRRRLIIPWSSIDYIEIPLKSMEV